MNYFIYTSQQVISLPRAGKREADAKHLKPVPVLTAAELETDVKDRKTCSLGQAPSFERQFLQISANRIGKYMEQLSNVVYFSYWFWWSLS